MKPKLLMLLLFAAIPAQAAVVSTNQLASVKLAWDRSADSSVAGYKLYWGPASRTYTNSINVGTNLTGTVSNVVVGVNYFYAATAWNAQNLESDFSNEVAHVVPWFPPTNPPSNLRITFQMQVSTHPFTNFANLAGASVTITNEVNPLVPGWFYKTLITTVPIP